MAPQQGGGEQSPYSGIIMMVLIIGVFYFFFIRPQQKKAKEAVKMREALGKGDKIVTWVVFMVRLLKFQIRHLLLKLKEKVV